MICIQSLAQYNEEQIENVFKFLHGFKNGSAEDLAGIEHVEGPVFDDPSVTTGTRPDIEDYDIGLKVAERIIGFLNSLDNHEKIGWENLDGLIKIPGFGPDKFHDIVYSADRKYGNRNLVKNWTNNYLPFVRQVLRFWNDWIDLRVNSSSKNAKQLVRDPKAFDRWVWTIRAISWFESRYGQGFGNYPDRDPMQSGNPNDTLWLELHGLKLKKIGEDTVIVKITDEGTPVVRGWIWKDNSHVKDLLADIKRLDPKITGKFSENVYDYKKCLTNSRNGHNDEKFSYKMSYFWGVLHFITKANGKYDYNCSDSTREHLLHGVSRYGPPNTAYTKRIANFLDSRGVFVSQPAP